MTISNYLENFLGLNKTEIEFHRARILYNVKDQLDGELPDLKNELQ